MAKKDKTQKQALETSQTSDIAYLTNQWQEHPVVGLTPVRLHRLLTGAEQGSLQAMADLFADMEERDGHIFSEMFRRKKGVNALPWGVNPPKNASEPEKKIAEQVYEWIDDIEDFEMMLFEAMDAVGHPQNPVVDIDETLDIIAPLGHTILALNAAPAIGDPTAAYIEHLDFVGDAIEQRPATLVIPFTDIELATAFAAQTPVETSYCVVAACYHGATGQAGAMAAALADSNDPAVPFNGVNLGGCYSC